MYFSCHPLNACYSIIIRGESVSYNGYSDIRRHTIGEIYSFAYQIFECIDSRLCEGRDSKYSTR